MIVKTLEDLKAAGQFRAKEGLWSSARYLVKKDGMGFTLTHTTLEPGQETTMEYKNHLEANLVIAGRGTVTDLATGREYELKAGTLYALDKHERHHLRCIETLTIVCVFTPALVGPETHDDDGSYPLLD